ncbi:MAG: thiol:disulfide interchange protein [Leptospiraceae bacterium]|nr:MAG: thiol:disulfide interchange protein [Leptospiraceae bacterium]
MEYIKENFTTILIFGILIAYLLYQRIPIYLNNSKLENISLKQDLTFVSIDGKIYQLSDLQNKTILINFWATWCLPCKIEIPMLENIYKELNPYGLEILGISSEDPETIKTYLKDKNISYPIIVDKDYFLTNYFNVRGYPTIIIIKNNKIIDVSTGLNVLLKWKIRWYVNKSIF